MKRHWIHRLICMGTLMIFNGCDIAPGDGLEALWEPFEEPTPLQAAHMANDMWDPDTRRLGLAWLSTADFASDEVYQRLFKLYLNDPSDEVRAIAVSALGKTGQPKDIHYIIIRLEKDHSPLVRWQAAVAMQKQYNTDAINPLINAFRKETDLRTRVACVNALGMYDDPRALRTLIEALDAGDYAIVAQAIAGLEKLTGQNFGDDGSAWLSWAQKTPQHQWFARQDVYFYPQFAPLYWFDYVTFWNLPKIRFNMPAGFAAHAEALPDAP